MDENSHLLLLSTLRLALGTDTPCAVPLPAQTYLLWTEPLDLEAKAPHSFSPRARHGKVQMNKGSDPRGPFCSKLEDPNWSLSAGVHWANAPSFLAPLVLALP